MDRSVVLKVKVKQMLKNVQDVENVENVEDVEDTGCQLGRLAK